VAKAPAHQPAPKPVLQPGRANVGDPTPINPMPAAGAGNSVTLPTGPSPLSPVPTGNTGVPPPNSGGQGMPADPHDAPHIV
jgi:hypothetical protein